MAKQLRDILKQASDTIKGVRPSTISPENLGGYEPKPADEKEFVAAHSVQKWDDPAGNPNFSKDIKHVLDLPKEDRHGHKNDEAKKKSILPVKESTTPKKAEDAQCNESAKGIACPVHGLAECWSAKTIKEDVSKLSDARLKFHALKGVPHGSFSSKEIKAEHQRRKSTGGAEYAAVKPALKEENVDEALGTMANIKKASIKGYMDSRKGQPPLTASDARTLGKVSDMMKKEKAIQAAKKVQKEETAEKTTLAQYKKKIHPQSDFEKKTFQEDNDITLEEAAKTGNVTYGYHGSMKAKDDTERDKKYSAMHTRVKKLVGSAGHLKDARHPNKMVKHFLDSSHGRHIADDDSDKNITNRFGHFKKSYKPEMHEEVALDEAVTVKKTTHPWGKMVTVHHGSSHSFPLHPEHQEKIAKLKDGEHTSFTDETNTKVKAHREGDTIHLSQRGVNKTTPVARHHFAEETQIDEVITKKTSAGEVISDFIHSDNPKFAGKSKEKRKQMALAAYYAKQRNEEVEEIDEAGVRPLGRAYAKVKDADAHSWAKTARPKAYKAPGTPSKAEVRSEIEKLSKDVPVKKLPAGKAKGIKEDLAVPLLGSNDDESAEMAKAQLKAIANKAMHLVTQIPDSMIVEPWVQSKINIAKDYVNTVHDYMVYGDHDKDNKEPTSDKSVVADQMDTPMTFPNMSVDVNTGQNV